MHRRDDQAGWFAPFGGAASPHLPLTFEVTFGAFPGPWDTTSVVLVQVAPLLLTETIVVLDPPAGRLPKEAT